MMSDYQGGYADIGYFLTGLMIVTGFCLPVVLAHAGVVSFSTALGTFDLYALVHHDGALGTND